MTTEIWYPLLISVLVATAMAAAAILVYLGYWMGRNSAELPVRSDNNPKLINQGSTDDPGGDPFEEAMTPVEPNPGEERIETMRR